MFADLQTRHCSLCLCVHMGFSVRLYLCVLVPVLARTPLALGPALRSHLWYPVDMHSGGTLFNLPCMCVCACVCK